MRPFRLRVVGGLVLAAGATFLVFTATTNCTAVTGTDDVAVNVSKLERGHAKLFCYKDEAGKQLRFVLARGQDGNVRSVFDACRQCFAFHRGYRIVNGELICRVCGNHYPLDRMAEGKASCVPESLPHEEDAGIVHIKTADLKGASSLF